MTSSSPQSNRRVTLVGLAIILLAVVFCVWPGMRAPLFSDDIHQLEKSTHFLKWTEIFNPDVFGFYRPVKNLLFMLCAPLSEKLLDWHLVGLAAYLAATAGVFRIVSICLGSCRAAWLAACLWALSPSCVSTVVWVSCANISIGLAFGGCLFHFHERWAVSPSRGTVAACIFFFAMALLCYESLIAVPALLFIRDFQQRRIGFNRKTVVRYSVYTLVALVFLIVRHHFSARNIADNYHSPGFSPDTTGLELSLSAPWFLWRHFLMWVFPFGKLEVLGNYAWLRSASILTLSLSWGFLLALLAVIALAWNRLPAVAYGLLFFVVASLPSGNFIPCFNGPINDAYVTIPSVGLAIAFASICETLSRQFLLRRREAKSGALAIIAVVATFLIYRLPVGAAYFRYWAGVWNNPAELMLLTYDARPFLYQPKAFASVLLFAGGYVEQATTIAKEVIDEDPSNPTARLTLARFAEYRKEYPLAEQYYCFVLNTPKLSKFVKDPATLELAEMLVKTPNRQKDAAVLFREFLQGARNSHQPEAIAQLSTIYREQGDAAKARTTLERGLSIYPDAEVLKMMLANLDHPASDLGPKSQ